MKTLALLILWAGVLRGEQFAAADNAFVGLLQQRGPVSMGLGSALMGMEGSSEALEGNVAGLAGARRAELGLGHSLLIQDVALETLKFNGTLSRGSGFGLQLQFLNQGSFERRDEGGQLLEGSFQPWGLNAMGGFARQVGAAWKAGISLGYLQQNYAAQSQRGFALGLGSQWAMSEAWTLAAGLKNLGGGAGQNPLPMTAGLGCGFHQKISEDNSLQLLAQFDYGTNSPSKLGLGMQYEWRQAFFLRAGYGYGLEEQTLAGLSGLGAGLGCRIQSMKLDYGLAFQGDLGMLQALTLAYEFPARAAHPASSETAGLLQQAREFHRQGKNAEAVKAYMQHLENNKGNKEAWVEVAKIYLAANRKEDAKKCLSWALSIAPEDPEVKKLMSDLGP